MGKQFFEAWTQNLGRNGWDQPLAIPGDMSAESMNIVLREGGLGVKRAGFEKVTIETGVGLLNAADPAKFVPGNNETAMELFYQRHSNASDSIIRLPAGTSSTVVLSSTNCTAPVSFAQLNGKFFIANNNGANRIRVYAPSESTTEIRFAGLKPEAAPTVANTGVGTYPAIPRTYRVVTKRIVSGVVVSQSEPSAEIAFTPSGTGTAARVTKAAASGEGETHWQVQAAAADDVFYGISGNIVVATTTYDDSVEPQNYDANGEVLPLIGSNYPFPGVRFLLSDGLRLYGLGVYQTSAGDSVPPVNGRLYFTPAYGSSDMGDDERIINTVVSSGWLDLAIGAGGADRGLGGPINNAIIAFQYRGVYACVPTGNADVPFRLVTISRAIGSVSGKSVVMAEDETGQPALYFLDPVNGPYRLTTSWTCQWLGKDVYDLWQTIVINSGTEERDFWGAYDNVNKRIVWSCCTHSGSDTATQIVFDVTNGVVVRQNEVRHGWTHWQVPTSPNPAFLLTGGVMFSTALQTTHPVTQALYISISGLGAEVAFIRQSASATQDASTSFKAYVRSRAYRWSPIGRLKKLLEGVVIAKASAATTIRALFIPNCGEQTGVTQNISIAPVGSSAYVRPRPNPIDSTDLSTLQIEIGDAAAANTPQWEIESAEVQVEVMDQAR